MQYHAVLPSPLVSYPAPLHEKREVNKAVEGKLRYESDIWWCDIIISSCNTAHTPLKRILEMKYQHTFYVGLIHVTPTPRLCILKIRWAVADD